MRASPCSRWSPPKRSTSPTVRRRRALREFLTLVRSHVPPLVEDRILGPELNRLADALTAQVFSDESDIHSDVTLDAG